MATATANSIELCNAAPVDMSIDASSSSPLGEDPATSGVQRLVVALVPDGVGESEAMENSTHVLAMVLHDEHVVVVCVFEQVALHSVPTREVPSPHVTIGAEHRTLPTCDENPCGHVWHAFAPAVLEYWSTGQAVHVICPAWS